MIPMKRATSYKKIGDFRFIYSKEGLIVVLDKLNGVIFLDINSMIGRLN